jgi:beta-galactosidase
VQDAEGVTVPTDANLVRFNLQGSGKILGVGNGDPSSHEPDQAKQRSAFCGFCQVIIQTTTQPGEMTLTAEAEGLVPAKIVFAAEPAETRPRL